MRHINQLIFDEYVPSTATVYSSSDLNNRLGQYDQLGVEVVIDNYTATTGKYTMGIDHSGDGRNWVQKNTFEVGSPPTNMASVAPTVHYHYDPSPGATLGLVRIWFAFDSTSTVTAAHVKIHVTARDNR